MPQPAGGGGCIPAYARWRSPSPIGYLNSEFIVLGTLGAFAKVRNWSSLGARREKMINTLLISFGDGMLMGRIIWPIDGTVLAFGMIAAFALLFVALLRESKPASTTIHMKPTDVRPISGALHFPHAA
jgi:hypothetical protein